MNTIESPIGTDSLRFDSDFPIHAAPHVFIECRVRVERVPYDDPVILRNQNI